jgi:hypothetical protein
VTFVHLPKNAATIATFVGTSLHSSYIFAAARRDSLVGVRDELDAFDYRPDDSNRTNRYHPVREMALSISAGFSRMEIACDESIEARRDSCRLRSERGALGCHAPSLQRLVGERRVTRTIAGVDCHERIGIGDRRVNRIQIAIEIDAALSERLSRLLRAAIGCGITAGSRPHSLLDCGPACAAHRPIDDRRR